MLNRRVGLIRLLLFKPFFDREFRFNVDCDLQANGHPQARLLKAIYPHFLQAVKKGRRRQKNLLLIENLHDVELKLAMKEARNSYAAMRAVQERLSREYKALMLVQSDSLFPFGEG